MAQSKEKKRKNKMRGKGKTGNREGTKIQQQLEATRNKNKLAFKKEYDRAKREGEEIEGDLEFLRGAKVAKVDLGEERESGGKRQRLF